LKEEKILMDRDHRAIPASALDDDDDEDEDKEISGEDNDDERIGTRYNYSFFHVIFAMGAMYVAMLLTNWYVSF
jgi:serine incorporator 1/3